MSYARTRINRLRQLMDSQGFDAFYLRGLSNIMWLTAFDGVFDAEDAHAVLVTDDEVVLHTDSRYARAARDKAEGTPVQVDDSSLSHAEFLTSRLEELKEQRISQAGDGLGESRTKEADKAPSELVLAIESSMSLGEYRGLEKAFKEGAIDTHIIETCGTVLSLRATKDSEELRRLKAAQAISDAAFTHIVDYLRSGLTEREVQIELEDYLIRHGATSLAFSSIVATGANGANPHSIPGETVLEAGQALVLDFGARAFGYCSDMTRTVFLGEPSTRMRSAYEALREANETVEALLKPGVTGKYAQEVAEKILAEAGFEGAMGHSLGHGVGIDVHEEPRLATKNDKELVSGNVVTVEPGIYYAHEFGMRLEDFGVVTDDGFDVFTQSSHDMVII